MIQDILCKINDLLDNKDKKEIQQLKQNGINLSDNILSYEVDCNNEEYTKTAINHALLDYNDVRFNHTVNIESEEQNKHSYCVCIKNSPYALAL